MAIEQLTHRQHSTAVTALSRRSQPLAFMTFRREGQTTFAPLQLPPLSLPSASLVLARALAGSIPKRVNGKGHNQRQEDELEIFERALQFRFNGAVADPTDRHVEEVPKRV